MLSSADLHVGDFDFRKVLAMPGVPAVPRAAREPEDPDLLALTVAHDFGRHLGALHLRRPRLDVLPVARDEDVVERHLIARLGIEQRDLDRDSWFGAELRAAGGENGVGHRAGTLVGIRSSVK